MANEIKTTEPKKLGIAGYLAQDAVKQNVANVVGQKDVQTFISSIVSAVQANPQLAECTNSSLLSAALLGHSLNLPPSPQLGKVYFVPYKNSKAGITEAQFMLSYKGYLELAMRSGQYRKIHVTDIREGELKSYDPIEDEYTFEPITDVVKRNEAPIIGYYGYFILTNGFKKALYWSKEKLEAHAKKYSAAYRKGWDSSLWKTDFDSMAQKTIIRQLISKHGVMSVEMQRGFEGDYGVIREDGAVDYIDNTPDEPEKAVDVMADVIETTAEEVTTNE